MPARIVIHSDDLGEAVHWIEFPVVRIGGSSHCDICIADAGLADHMLTMEYHDGEYRVHNRSESAIYVENEAVEAGSTRFFGAGQELQLVDGISLLLEIEGDPSPSPALATVAPSAIRQKTDFPHRLDRNGEISDEVTGAEAEAGSAVDAKSLIQVGVIIACVVGIAAVLLSKPGEAEGPPGLKVPEVRELVESVQTERDRRLLGHVQRAEAARLRGQTAVAREQLFRLRDALPRQSQDVGEQGFRDMAARFVEDRIWKVKE